MTDQQVAVQQADPNAPVQLRVNEIFGPTIQGEGPASGRLCAFVRLSGCNLDCRWCDTPYTWRWKHLKWPDQDPGAPEYDQAAETHGITADVIRARINDMNPCTNLVVISGGEPMIQRAGVRQLATELRDHGYQVHVETNGTLRPLGLEDLIDQFVVSPKLAHSGVDPDKALRPDVLRTFAGLGAAAKVVVKTEDDVRAVMAMTTVTEWPLDRVWIMPEGTTRPAIEAAWPEVAGWAVEYGINASSRLHVLAWNDRRGV